MRSIPLGRASVASTGRAVRLIDAIDPLPRARLEKVQVVRIDLFAIPSARGSVAVLDVAGQVLTTFEPVAGYPERWCLDIGPGTPALHELFLVVKHRGDGVFASAWAA